MTRRRIIMRRGVALLTFVGALSAASAVPLPLERYNLHTCTHNADGTIPAQRGDKSLTGVLVPSDPIDIVCVGGAMWAFVGLQNRRIRLESNNTFANFQNHFSQVGMLSVSLWMTPMSAGFDGLRPILTLGGSSAFRESGQAQVSDYRYSSWKHRYSSWKHRSDDQGSSATSSSVGCQGFDFRLAQLGSTLMVSFTDERGLCETRFVQQVELVANLTHVVVACGQTDTQIYLNGMLVTVDHDNASPTATVNVPNWNNGACHTLQLFSSNYENDVFLGSLSQIDLYDQTLMADDVTVLFTSGLGDQDATSAPSDLSTGSPVRKTSPSPAAVPTNLPLSVPSPFRSMAPRETPSQMPSFFPSESKIVALEMSTMRPTVASSASTGDMKHSAQPTSERPSVWPNTPQIEVESSVKWQSVALGIVGTTMALFCLWSVFGGWPRFVAHRYRTADPGNLDESAVFA